MRLALEHLQLERVSVADTAEGGKGLLLHVKVPLVFAPHEADWIARGLTEPPARDLSTLDVDANVPDFPPAEEQ